MSTLGQIFLALALIAVVLLLSGCRRSVPHGVKRDIATYIDGSWINGEYRGCMLLPPERKNLYCGVNPDRKQLPWPEVINDREHTHIMSVTFEGNQEALFWRCQRQSEAISCRDAGVNTEVK